MVGQERLRRLSRAFAALALPLLLASFAAAETIEVPSYDGFALRAIVERPARGKDSDARNVVVLIHGSGPQNADEDLSSLSAPGTTNQFFVDVSRALVAEGFAVVRYDKRTYAARERVRKDPAFLESPTAKALRENPLKAIVDDAAHMVGWAKARFPNAQVRLLGHSEGGYVALQVASTVPGVDGVALVGFTYESLDAVLLEQYVYRPLWIFDGLDADKDGRLSALELKGEDRFQKAIARQAQKLDLDGDGFVGRAEFKAGNAANLLLDDEPSLAAYRKQEAAYPRAGALLRAAAYDVCFFQGEWDNQTPAYYARGVQLMNKSAWGKKNFHFRFFPKLGHALDPRESENDLTYRPADRAALRTMAADLSSRWRPQPLPPMNPPMATGSPGR